MVLFCVLHSMLAIKKKKEMYQCVLRTNTKSIICELLSRPCVFPAIKSRLHKIKER
jgi:hypothetical protein